MIDQKRFMCFLMLAILTVGLGLTSGCAESGSSGGVASLPKQTFHRPETGDQAVTRMKQLVEAIVAQDSLPAPIEYSVREVIHGTGASAHSHYYLIGEDGQSIDEDHTEADSSEVRHEVQVDALTEFYDIVRWLPKTAALGSLKKKQWDAINGISKEMVSVMSIFDSDETTEEQKRDLVRENSQQFTDWIGQIESNFGTQSSKPDGNQE